MSLVKHSTRKGQFQRHIECILVSHHCYNKFSGISNANLLSYDSVGQTFKTGLTRLKSKDGQCCFPLETPKENLFFCFIQLLEAIHIPWLMAPCLSPQAQQCNISLALLPSLYFLLWLLIPSSTFKDPCDHMGPTQVIQVKLLILRTVDQQP